MMMMLMMRVLKEMQSMVYVCVWCPSQACITLWRTRLIGVRRASVGACGVTSCSLEAPAYSPALQVRVYGASHGKCGLVHDISRTVSNLRAMLQFDHTLDWLYNCMGAQYRNATRSVRYHVPKTTDQTTCFMVPIVPSVVELCILHTTKSYYPVARYARSM